MVRPSLLRGHSHIETDIFTDQRRHTSWKRLYYYSTKDKLDNKNPTKILNTDKIPKVEFDTSDRLIPPLTSYATKKSAEFQVYFFFSFSSIFLFLWIIDYTESLVTTNINVKTFTLNTGYQHHVHFVVGSLSAELSLLVFSWILKVLNSLSSSPSSLHNLSHHRTRDWWLGPKGVNSVRLPSSPASFRIDE